jgi:hypothetical protein
MFFLGFDEIRIFSADFRKILKYKISPKFFQWEPSYSTQTDGQTKDRQTEKTKLIVVFHISVEVPKMFGYVS